MRSYFIIPRARGAGSGSPHCTHCRWHINGRWTSGDARETGVPKRAFIRRQPCRPRRSLLGKNIRKGRERIHGEWVWSRQQHESVLLWCWAIVVSGDGPTSKQHRLDVGLVSCIVTWLWMSSSRPPRGQRWTGCCLRARQAGAVSRALPAHPGGRGDPTRPHKRLTGCAAIDPVHPRAPPADRSRDGAAQSHLWDPPACELAPLSPGIEPLNVHSPPSSTNPLIPLTIFICTHYFFRRMSP